MKLKSICLISLIFCGPIFAGEPHIVPADNCPTGEECCPKEVYCDNVVGCDEGNRWRSMGSHRPPDAEVTLYRFDRVQIQPTPYRKQILLCYYVSDMGEPGIGSQGMSLSLLPGHFKMTGEVWKKEYLERGGACMHYGSTKHLDPEQCSFQEIK